MHASTAIVTLAAAVALVALPLPGGLAAVAALAGFHVWSLADV